MGKVVQLTILALIVLTVHSKCVVDVADSANDDSDSSGDNEVDESARDRRRNITGAQVTRSINAFKEIAIRTLILNGMGPLAHPIGIFAAVVSIAVNHFGPQQRDVWSRIESQVTYTIREHQTNQYFNILKTRSEELMATMNMGEEFNLRDLATIVGKKNAFFPQNHDALNFNSKFIAAMKTYLLYASAGYLTLIQKGQLPNGKCQFAEELGVIRNDIIVAAKALHKKRYKAIEGTKSQLGCIEKKPGRQRPGCGFCGDSGSNNCNLYHSFTYKDKTTNVERKEFSPNIKLWVFGEIQKNTTDMIMEFVDIVNENYLVEDICQEGCNCPDKIRREDVEFEYPRECYENGNKGCVIPCFSYGYSYKWCTKGLWAQNWRRNNWNYCEQKNLEECMPTSTTNMVILNSNSLDANLIVNGEPNGA